MSTEFTWKVSQMESYPSKYNEYDVVFNVDWICNAVKVITENISGSDVSRTYRASNSGRQKIPYISGSSFTPYNELTNEQVLGWVFENMNVHGESSAKDAVENQLENVIEYQINPPTEKLPLPWM